MTEMLAPLALEGVAPSMSIVGAGTDRVRENGELAELWVVV